MSPPHLSYLICTTPRTGSNFLCELLRSTGVAGHPDDYFWNPPFWYQQWDVSSFPSYFGRILEEGCTDNGVFGVKMMWHYLDGLLPQLASTCSLQGAQPAEIVAAAFPNLRYLWLRRGDKVRQAISLYRALETRIWRSTDGGKGEDREPTFNLVAIDQLVQLTLAEDQAWHAYFQQYSLQPWVVTYEDLAASSEDVIVAILDHLGLPHQARPLRSRWRHQKQADNLTEEWVRRYVAFKGSLPSS